MRRIPIPIQSARTASLPVSPQRLVNMYAEPAPQSAKDAVYLRPSPGLTLYATCGEGPIRGIQLLDSGHGPVLYVVSGRKVFSLGYPSGITNQIGSIEGDGPVTMAVNRTQLVFTSGGHGYIIENGVLNEITDADFQPPSSVTNLDGYFIFSREGDDQFFLSDLANGNQYDPLAFATAEARPDALVRAFNFNRQLWLFGTETIEIWYNSGESPFPFVRASGQYIERGLQAAGSVAVLGEQLFYLGSDLKVYVGGTAISTPTLEYEIGTYGPRVTGSAVGMAWTLGGHQFYSLKFPGRSCFVYDVTTRLWHERESYGRDAWRGGCHYHLAIDSVDFIGDDTDGRVYMLDTSVSTEAGEPIRRVMVTPPLFNERDRFVQHCLELDCEMGLGLSTGQGSDPQISLRISDDGGKTWGAERWRGIGAQGQYRNRVRWNRLGQTYTRTFELAFSDALPLSVHGLYAEVG